jgi:hypothetical protein
MSKDLDVKIYLALDKAEHQIRRSAYLSNGRAFSKKNIRCSRPYKRSKRRSQKKDLTNDQ